MKNINIIKIISIVLIMGIMLSFCGCKKMNATESNFSSGYIAASDFVSSDDYVEQYYTLTQPDGTKVVVNGNGEIVENTTINEDGSITITDKDTGKTTNIGAGDVKDFDATIGENDTSSTVTNPTVSTSTSSKTEATNPSNDKKPTSNNTSSTASTPTTSTDASTTPPTTSSNTTVSTESNPATELTPLTAAEIKQVEDYFFQLVNEERARVGVQPLTRNSTLDKAANIRVNETLTNFSHTRPDGKGANSVLTDVTYGIKGENIWSDDGINWNTEIEYSAGAFGEILTNAGVISSPQQKENLKNIAQEMFNAYKNSQGHYSHMISKSYTKVGISIISYRNENIITQHNLTIFTEQ